jgi:hypothetical protein
MPDTRIVRVCIDWAVSLNIGVDGTGVEVRIEQPCRLSRPAEGVIPLVPDGDPGELAPVLRLVRQTVSRLDAFKDGHLEVELTGGDLLTVAATDDFEAWQVSGASGARVVSVPGGTVAVWSGTSVEDRH